MVDGLALWGVWDSASCSCCLVSGLPDQRGEPPGPTGIGGARIRIVSKGFDEIHEDHVHHVLFPRLHRFSGGERLLRLFSISPAGFFEEIDTIRQGGLFKLQAFRGGDQQVHAPPPFPGRTDSFSTGDHPGTGQYIYANVGALGACRRTPFGGLLGNAKMQGIRLFLKP